MELIIDPEGQSWIVKITNLNQVEMHINNFVNQHKLNDCVIKWVVKGEAEIVSQPRVLGALFG